MSRLIGPKCRICRMEGEKLLLKGKRCEAMRCAIERNPSAPGQHGAKRKRPTDYGTHLREKQKLKRIYGVTERQFKHYFNEAQRRTGNTGENLLVMLETRLDNLLFNCGWAASRSQARQFILHRHIAVNNRIINIASYSVAAGDTIGISSHERSKKMVQLWQAELKRETLPAWVKSASQQTQLQIVQLPKREDITTPINEQLVVEFATR